MNNDEKKQVLEEENVIQTTSNETKPKKKKGKIIVIILLLLIAIAIGLYVGIQKLTTNPMSIYKSAINETYDLVDNFLEEQLKNAMQVDLSKEPVLVNSNFTLTSNMDELSALSDYEYNLSVGLNIPEEQMNLSLGLADDNGKIIDLLLAFINNRAYLQSDELYDQVLDLGLTEMDFSSLNLDTTISYDYDTLHVILSKMKNILINSLDKNKFTVEEETITIDDKEIDAKNYAYLLDQENMERTINYITEEMIKDEELMDALATVTALSKDELTEALQEEIDYSDYTDITINLYTNNKNEIIAGNVTEQESALIRFTNQDNEFALFIGDEYTNFTVDKIDNVIDIAYNEYGEEILSLSLTNDDNTQKIEINVYDYGDTYTYGLELSNVEESENTCYADFKLDFYMESYEEEISFELDGNFELEKSELESIDTTNSVDIETLTEEQALVFYENLLNVLERLGLSSYAENL